MKFSHSHCQVKLSPEWNFSPHCFPTSLKLHNLRASFNLPQSCLRRARPSTLCQPRMHSVFQFSQRPQTRFLCYLFLSPSTHASACALFNNIFCVLFVCFVCVPVCVGVLFAFFIFLFLLLPRVSCFSSFLPGAKVKLTKVSVAFQHCLPGNTRA